MNPSPHPAPSVVSGMCFGGVHRGRLRSRVPAPVGLTGDCHPSCQDGRPGPRGFPGTGLAALPQARPLPGRVSKGCRAPRGGGKRHGGSQGRNVPGEGAVGRKCLEDCWASWEGLQGQERGEGWGRRGRGGAGEGTGPKRSKALGCWGTPILLGHWALGWHPCPPGAEFCGRQTTTGK